MSVALGEQPKLQNNIYIGKDTIDAPSKAKFCLCRGEEKMPMVQCDSCEEWFHFKCVLGNKGEPPKGEESFICGWCEDHPLSEERAQEWDLFLQRPEVSAFAVYRTAIRVHLLEKGPRTTLTQEGLWWEGAGGLGRSETPRALRRRL